MAYNVSNRYKELRYSGDNDNQLYLEYNNTLVENAPTKTENLKWNRRILDNGSKTLTLDNFVSQTIELTIRDYEVSDTTKEFYIKIGSMVDGAYEYVPLGYYHIKDNPSTANGKTIYKLTDRSTKFDVYIDLSEFIKQHNGKITKLQAVQEYCRQCGVIFANTSFLGSNEEIGIYDNTITARVHIMYLAECSGCIAIIGRDGRLYFIPLVKPNETNTHTIPEQILNNNMNNSKGSFRISKVVYEGALMPFEAGDDTRDTLFLNTSNPYISKQEDIDRIYNQVVGLEIDNISTSSIIGDPSIDPYDYIQYTHTDDNGNDKETFTSLAQYDLEFNGVFKQTFNTSIDREKKKINSTVNSPTTKMNRLKQEVDTVKGELKITAEKVDENTTQIASLGITADSITSLTGKVSNLEVAQENSYKEIQDKFEDYVPQSEFVQLETNVTQIQADTYTKTEINTKLTDGSVTKVKTISGTFDEDGMHYAKTDAPTSSTINEKGVEVEDSNNKDLLYSGYVDEKKIKENVRLKDFEGQSVVYTQNVIVDNYFVVGTHSRTEDYEEEVEQDNGTIVLKKGTGVFYVGG